jgi:hypothetical protein
MLCLTPYTLLALRPVLCNFRVGGSLGEGGYLIPLKGRDGTQNLSES